jgi:hypothetical protein
VKRASYTVEVVGMPMPGYSHGASSEPTRVPAPRHCPCVETALGNAGQLAQEGYRVKITGPDGVWDHKEVLRRLNTRKLSPSVSRE